MREWSGSCCSQVREIVPACLGFAPGPTNSALIGRPADRIQSNERNSDMAGSSARPGRQERRPKGYGLLVFLDFVGGVGPGGGRLDALQPYGGVDHWDHRGTGPGYRRVFAGSPRRDVELARPPDRAAKRPGYGMAQGHGRNSHPIGRCPEDGRRAEKGRVRIAGGISPSERIQRSDARGVKQPEEGRKEPLPAKTVTGGFQERAGIACRSANQGSAETAAPL